MSKPKLLDLFCCAGGAGMGYHRAGFEVIGVDLFPQPHYPFAFVQADAIALLETLLSGRAIEVGGKGYLLEDFAAIHASPPCQAFTNAQKIMGNEHPNLIDPTRELLALTGLPWIIENVIGAPLFNPVMLCGSMFPGLQVYRHRLFESNFPLEVPEHPAHVARITKMGRAPIDGEFMHVVGNFSGVTKAKAAMGIDWMVRDELREAIPPAFTHYIGRQMLGQLTMEEAA